MKKSLGKKTIILTHPVLVIGSYSEEGKPNLMTASWGGICCSEPPLYYYFHQEIKIILQKYFA